MQSSRKKHQKAKKGWEVNLETRKPGRHCVVPCFRGSKFRTLQRETLAGFDDFCR